VSHPTHGSDAVYDSGRRTIDTDYCMRARRYILAVETEEEKTTWQESLGGKQTRKYVLYSCGMRLWPQHTSLPQHHQHIAGSWQLAAAASGLCLAPICSSYALFVWCVYVYHLHLCLVVNRADVVRRASKSVSRRPSLQAGGLGKNMGVSCISSTTTPADARVSSSYLPVCCPAVNVPAVYPFALLRLAAGNTCTACACLCPPVPACACLCLPAVYCTARAGLRSCEPA
jgi:hypothetical protein